MNPFPNRPAAVQNWLISRAQAKRLRRASKLGASKYAKGNIR